MSTITTVFTVTFAVTGLSSVLAAVVAKAALNRLHRQDTEEATVSVPTCDFYALNPNLQTNLATAAREITNGQNFIAFSDGLTIEKDSNLNILRVRYPSKKF